MIKILLVVVIIYSLIGCASKTVDLKPTSPSETKLETFNGYSCNQISNKLAYLEKKLKESRAYKMIMLNLMQRWHHGGGCFTGCHIFGWMVMVKQKKSLSPFLEKKTHLKI